MSIARLLRGAFFAVAGAGGVAGGLFGAEVVRKEQAQHRAEIAVERAKQLQQTLQGDYAHAARSLAKLRGERDELVARLGKREKEVDAAEAKLREAVKAWETELEWVHSAEKRIDEQAHVAGSHLMKLDSHMVTLAKLHDDAEMAKKAVAAARDAFPLALPRW